MAWYGFAVPDARHCASRADGGVGPRQGVLMAEVIVDFLAEAATPADFGAARIQMANMAASMSLEASERRRCGR
jgi:hypothetical protein